MKLFLDTTQRIFVATILNENDQPIFSKFVDTKYKVEEIIDFFNNVPNFDSIKQIYINLGPGSFTGSRIGLLYVRTIAQLNSEIEVFTTNTFNILKIQNPKKIIKKFFIFATKNKSYYLTKDKMILYHKKSKKELEINYDLLLKNFSKNEKIFSKSNIASLMPIYISQPHIGEQK